MALSTKTLDALNDSRKTEPHKYIWGQFTPDKDGVGYSDLPEQTIVPDDAKLVLDVNGPSLVKASVKDLKNGISESIATTEKAGIVKPDGTTISVSSDGTISSSGSGFDFEGTKAAFDAAVAAGTITDDSVSIITDDVSGDAVATKADLAVVENNSNNLTNLSDTGKTKLKNSLTNYALRFPDYNAAITLDSTVNVKKQYIAPNDGWISYTLFERTNTTDIVASVDTPGKGAVVWINGNRISEVANWDAYVHYITSYLFHPVKAGDVIDYYIFSQGFLYFYPMLGAN